MNTMKYTLIASFFIVASCNQQQDSQEKLKEKRAQLKSEIDAIDLQLETFDSGDEVFLPLVELEKVALESFKHRISVQGAIETDKEVMLNAEMGGLLESIRVKEGQAVSSGQVLAIINSDIVNSNIKELENQLEFARYAYGKQEELRKRNLGTEFEFKQAFTQVTALESQLSTLRKQKDKSVIKSPFAGIVDQIFPKEGELTGPQQPLMRIVNNKEVRVIADISERHYNAVKQGSEVKVFVPTLGDTIHLKVTNVGNYIHPTNRTFRVRADISDNKLLLPNMLAQLIITDLTIDSALVIPSSAVLKSQLNEDYVFVARKSDEGTFLVSEVIVEVISRYDGKSAVRVVKGELKGNDFVVTRGGRGITNNDVVRIQ